MHYLKDCIYKVKDDHDAAGRASHAERCCRRLQARKVVITYAIENRSR